MAVNSPPCAAPTSPTNFPKNSSPSNRSPRRSASRLLTLDGATGALADRQMRELPQLVAPGDLLVFNDTTVIPARLFALKDSGGKVELLLERPLDSLISAGARARQQAAAARHAAAEPRRRHQASSRSAATCGWSNYRKPPLAFFERYGQMPLPPYIRREPDAADSTRYQSVFARRQGAVAAPTASLHFDDGAARGARRRAARSARSSRCTWARAPSSPCAPMRSART